VARNGADGLLVGCCRQVPMLGYNPTMVAAYKTETGIDANTIDPDKQPEQYTQWLRWRADHFTELLRDLHKELVPIRQESGRPIPVAVRVPTEGLFHNLAEGLDIEQWLREGLVNQLQLDPFEDRTANPNHDVRPYIRLARQYRVSVVGGIGYTWRMPGGYVTAMHRALGLIEAGVDGIEIYESNEVARCGAFRWILPLFGNAKKLRTFLAESNMEACYPISAASAVLGHDNHSTWTIIPHYSL